MIRIEEPDGWILIGHRDHAALAAKFATHWGNGDFVGPEPRNDVLNAVVRHDDAWVSRDAQPFVTRDGKPSAFSRELVGTYSAFEEMDLADYLGVRGRAAAIVAAENPYAAVLISMHTVNLLTERADTSKLAPEERETLRTFIEAQEASQADLRSRIAADPDSLRRGFEFLQACDSLSLMACVRYQKPIPLRHSHPRSDGSRVPIECIPMGDDTYRISPYPFDGAPLRATVVMRRLAKKKFANDQELRAAFDSAEKSKLEVLLIR
jgi:hypothetical protein